MLNGFSSFNCYFVICIVSMWQTKIIVFYIQIQIWFNELAGKNIKAFKLPLL